MKEFDTYVIILCIVVFLALTAMFTTLIAHIIKSRLKMISGGLADDEILKEQQKMAKQKHPKARQIIGQTFSILFCLLVIGMFILSICININSNKKVGNVPVLKVVTSSSMATKYEKNTYLDENNITNRIQRFDIISLSALPSEKDLKLYDIVAYEFEGMLIVHRIIEIQEPNEEHSERLFRLQGDANQVSDRFPVRYEQMRGIYNGTRVPFVGSFVIFMHSPAGYLCVLLVVFVSIALPLVEKKLNSAVKARLDVINTPKKTQRKNSKAKKVSTAKVDDQGQKDKKTGKNDKLKSDKQIKHKNEIQNDTGDTK